MCKTTFLIAHQCRTEKSTLPLKTHFFSQLINFFPCIYCVFCCYCSVHTLITFLKKNYYYFVIIISLLWCYCTHVEDWSNIILLGLVHATVSNMYKINEMWILLWSFFILSYIELYSVPNIYRIFTLLFYRIYNNKNCIEVVKFMSVRF